MRASTVEFLAEIMPPLTWDVSENTVRSWTFESDTAPYVGATGTALLQSLIHYGQDLMREST